MPSLTKKPTAAVLGGRGMLGSDLVEFLNDAYETFALDKENYNESCDKDYDILINANGNSRRFWANQNPYQDFEASVVSVYRSLNDFKFQKYIYISSSDVYPEHGSSKSTSENQTIDPAKLSPYGFHKYLSEEIIKNRVKNYLIIRSSMILGTKLRKGPFYDITEGKPLFISPDSKLQLITSEEISNVIKFLLENVSNSEIFNVGGRGIFSFENLGRYFPGRKIEYSPQAERQEYEMNVEKLSALYPVKSSAEYLADFLKK